MDVSFEMVADLVSCFFLLVGIGVFAGFISFCVTNGKNLADRERGEQ